MFVFKDGRTIMNIIVNVDESSTINKYEITVGEQDQV